MSNIVPGGDEQEEHQEKKKKAKLPSKKSSSSSKSNRLLHITDLPFEILYTIMGYLESFSICNLAMTCTYLRYVCCSLLDTRGCVSLKWKRTQKDDKVYWDVAYKQWFFSTAMDPIKSWIFNKDIGKISEHMKTCQYNVRTCHSSHNKKTVDPKWDDVLKSLKSRLELKRRSEWFV